MVAETFPLRALVVVVSPRTAAAALFTAIDDVDDDMESNLFSESCCWYWLPLFLYPDDGVDDEE